jgi:hypothetical protein
LLDLWQQAPPGNHVKTEKCDDQEQRDNRVGAMAEGIDIPQPAAREDNEKDGDKEDYFNAVIDSPDIQVCF